MLNILPKPSQGNGFTFLLAALHNGIIMADFYRLYRILFITLYEKLDDIFEVDSNERCLGVLRCWDGYGLKMKDIESYVY